MASVGRNRQRSFSAIWAGASTSRYTPSRNWSTGRTVSNATTPTAWASYDEVRHAQHNHVLEGVSVDNPKPGRSIGTKAGVEQALVEMPGAEGVEAFTDRFPLYKPEQPLPAASVTATLPKLPKQSLSSLRSETDHLRHSLSQRQKLQESEAETAHMKPLTEEELERFYGALIAYSEEGENGVSTAGLLGQGERSDLKRIGEGSGMRGDLVLDKKMRLGRKTRRHILTGLMGRLRVEATQATGEASGAENDGGAGSTGAAQGLEKVERASQKTSGAVILQMIRDLTPADATPTTGWSADGGIEALHTGLIRKIEWEALFEEFMASGNVEAVEEVLVLKKEHGGVHEAAQLEALLGMYVRKGDVRGLGDLLERLPYKLGVMADRALLSHMVDVHLANGDTYSAVRTLDNFQASDRVLPQAAYTKILDALIPTPGRRSLASTPQQDKAIAWDLLARMRLTAHPRPSVQTYNVMIRACADPDDPQPERALDTLVEMDTETKVKPDGATFDAAILACSRVKKFYLEGFRLLGRMLEMHKSALDASRSTWATAETSNGGEAYVSTGYEPTLATFNALLEGCKRRGDLSRARWILAEVVKLISDGAGQGVDEEMVVNVFHTYAAFKPLVARHDVKTRGTSVKPADAGPVSGGETGMETSSQNVDDAHIPAEADQSVDVAFAATSSTLLDLASPDAASPVGPQSATEVLQEADRLFDLVIASQAEPSSPFSTVPLTARLVNAYLSVQFAHRRLDQALDIWSGIWQNQPILGAAARKNGHSYVMAFERCAMAKGDPAKTLVHRIIPGMWKEYLEWLNDMESGAGIEVAKRKRLGLDPRHLEKAWTQSIRAHALVNRLSESMSILAEFRDRYPPSQVGSIQPTPHIPVSGFSMSSPGSTLEDNVPPHILFHDVDVLHHRLVTAGDLQGVGQLKWTCLSYQSALQARRNRRIRSTTQGNIRQLLQTPQVDAKSPEQPMR